jgi:hypothetical protein
MWRLFTLIEQSEGEKLFANAYIRGTNRYKFAIVGATYDKPFTTITSVVHVINGNVYYQNIVKIGDTPEGAMEWLINDYMHIASHYCG